MSEKTSTPNNTVRPPWLYGELSHERWRELEREGIGWKLHLNFDPQNLELARLVTDQLEELKEDGQIAKFKLGNGGGAEDGAPGKEATIYIGPFDKAVRVTTQIESKLGTHLTDPEGDALIDDTPFTSKIMARFDIGGTRLGRDPDFHQYGANGVPYLNKDMDPFNKKPRNIAITNATEVLNHRYGAYFMGFHGLSK